MTLCVALERLTDETRGITFISGDRRQFLSFAAIGRLTEDLGRRARALELGPGQRCLLILPDQQQFTLAFLSMIRAGVVPVPVFPPFLLGQLDAYQRRLRAIADSAEPDVIVTSEALRDFCAQTTGVPSLTFEEIEAIEPAGGPLDAARAEDMAFLQYTSGSTADPKGVMVTHGNLLANANMIATGLGIDPRRDRGVSWLPLYHDMGLIGMVITPIIIGVPMWQIATQDFARQPTLWLDWISQVGGTLSFAPSFAYELAAKRATTKQIARWDLRPWRVAGCGAEPVRTDVLRRFQAALAPAGLRPTAPMPCYGLAEATLAVAFSRWEGELRTLTVHAPALRSAGQAKVVSPGAADSVELVSCGPALAECELRIVDDAGRSMPPGHEGEILVRADSVATGYWRDPVGSARTFREGWLHTGDLGLLHDGELYVTGRAKDLIIHCGRNYHPQDIEWGVGALRGVRTGHVVAFSGARDELVVAAEVRSAASPALRDEISAQVRSEFGIVPGHVVLVERNALPKTSSGKLRRRETQAQYRLGALPRAVVA